MWLRTSPRIARRHPEFVSRSKVTAAPSANAIRARRASARRVSAVRMSPRWAQDVHTTPPPLRVPARILSAEIAATTDRAAVERWAEPQPGEEAKLEYAQALRAGPPCFQPQQEFS